MQVIDSKLLDSDGYIKEDSFTQELESFYVSDKYKLIISAIALLKANCKSSTLHPTGISSFVYAIEMAYILFKLKADEESVAAGLLYDLYSFSDISDEQVLESCGDIVLRILQGTKKMSAIRMYRSDNISLEQIDTFRKMLLTIIEDVRIVLVKIVDKLCTVRYLKSLHNEEAKQTIAREALDIYAPLANRLGLSQIKWELEDRAFFFLNNQEYRRIAKAIGMTRLQREEYLNNVMSQLTQAISMQMTEVEISGRVKHIYSIWKKLRNKGYSGLDRLFDITALRIVTNDVDECYRALAIVNHLWLPVAEEFSDYIVNPKPNGYKSIHTVVNAYGNPLEVQIRTHKMHQESELGFAAHWRYKEGVRFDASYEARVAWLRSLLEWEKEINEDISKVSKELNNRVYVFTPANELIDLSNDSTVLDFAYSVHTMVGHRTRGAKVNGRIVPLTTKLQTGDRVEILTHKEPNPSKDWATESLGFLSSTKNRARVTKWFNEQNKEENVVLGRERLNKELKGYELKNINYLDIAKRFNMQSEETLFASIENGKVRIKSVINHILDHYSVEQRDIKRGSSGKSEKETGEKRILIHGYTGMKYVLAKCCQPTSDDKIAGYMSVGKGVVIHTLQCPNLKYLKKNNPERFIDVKWQSNQKI